MEEINKKRRLILEGGVAALLAKPTGVKAWGEPKPQAFEKLKNFEFIDQNGLPISGNNLQSIVGNSNFTVSFGFNGTKKPGSVDDDNCKSFCPLTNSLIGSLATEFNHSLKHVIINVNPEVNGKTQQSRDSYVKSVTHNEHGVPFGVKPENLIVLYPKNKNNALDNSLPAEISDKLGVTMIKGDHTQHNGFVTLYDKSGKYKARSPGSDKPEVIRNIINKFKAALNGRSL